MSAFEQEANCIANLNKHKSMNNSSDKTLAMILLAIVGILLLLPLGWVYGWFAYGFVLAKIWGWFMVAAPFSLPAITWVQAAALFMVVRFLTSTHTVKINSNLDKDKEVSDKVVELLVPLLSPWITLFIAWVFKAVFM